jgi:hypothetical protein
MHRHANRILRGLAIVVALASIMPAAATAGRWGPGTPSGANEQPTVHMTRGTCHQYCSSVDQHLAQTHPGRPTSTMRPRIVTVIADGGFNWSDAAIGFGAACGLVLLSLGSLLLRRQAGIRHAREPA